MSPRRAMTLIELLVALTLLGMMSALASLTWSSLRGWDQSAEAAQRALRPQRVVMMLERQWAARAAMSNEEEPLGRPEAEPRSLRFTTRRSALHPAWPTVEASYTIDRTDPRRQKLLYAETRLGPLGGKLSNQPEPPITLLDAAANIELRYRVEREPESAGETEILWTTDPGALTLQETRLLAVELTATLENGEGVEWIGIVAPSR